MAAVPESRLLWIAPSPTEIAAAMKDWAIERALPTTPLVPAHDGLYRRSLRQLRRPNVPGTILTMELPAKSCRRSGADASASPSGGLRGHLRGPWLYNAWDPTSYAFIKDQTLYIPTIFCSYGETLDKKRRPAALMPNSWIPPAVRILRLFGNTTVQHVTAQVGPGRVFLIDKSHVSPPEDQFSAARLFGAKPPKGGSWTTYYSAIKPRVAFMHERIRSCGRWACWPRRAMGLAPWHEMPRCTPTPTAPATTIS